MIKGISWSFVLALFVAFLGYIASQIQFGMSVLFFPFSIIAVIQVAINLPVLFFTNILGISDKLNDTGLLAFLTFVVWFIIFLVLFGVVIYSSGRIK